MVVNNIGVKPAGPIATLPLYKSADLHEEKFPETTRQIRKKSYVDDLGLTGNNMNDLRQRTMEADCVLKHANMHVKRWTYSGDTETSCVNVGENAMNVNSENTENERMLGILWDPVEDAFKFKVTINMSPLKNKSRTGPDLTREQLLANPPDCGAFVRAFPSMNTVGYKAKNQEHLGQFGMEN